MKQRSADELSFKEGTLYLALHNEPDLQETPQPRWDFFADGGPARLRRMWRSITSLWSWQRTADAKRCFLVPNIPLFRRLEADGRILSYDWEKYNGKKDVVFQPALMSPQELLMGMEWAARQFYSIPCITERMWKSTIGLWWNIVRNVGYHLALRNFGKIGYNPELQPSLSMAETLHNPSSK